MNRKVLHVPSSFHLLLPLLRVLCKFSTSSLRALSFRLGRTMQFILSAQTNKSFDASRHSTFDHWFQRPLNVGDTISYGRGFQSSLQKLHSANIRLSSCKFLFSIIWIYLLHLVCREMSIELEYILGLMTRRTVLKAKQTISYQMPRRQDEGGGRVRYGRGSNCWYGLDKRCYLRHISTGSQSQWGPSTVTVSAVSWTLCPVLGHNKMLIITF